MAAVLLAGPEALLSHASAGALWAINSQEDPRIIEVTVPNRRLRAPGLQVHRRARLPEADRAERDGIRVTSPARTLIDLAIRFPPRQLEAAVNKADKLDLIDPESLRRLLEMRPGLRGVTALRSLLDRRTFVLTDSDLERRFLPLARRAGLPSPQTGVIVNGFKVDFYWPELGLVVETDGLRYHRTAAQQARDRERDQAHAAAGLTPLRFTHAQVAFEADRVVATLQAVVARLRMRAA
jgi:very-short-patch-repair endonuclease